MTTTWPTVCATGHRPQHLRPNAPDWIRPELARIAAKLRDEHGTRVAISGMALGVDQWWAQAALDAGLALWAYVPFPQQPDRWLAEEQNTWQRLIEQAAKVKHFGDLDGIPARHRKTQAIRLLHARNGGMLADADAVLAVWDEAKTGGGTVSAVRKARGRHLPVVHVDPVERRTALRISWAVQS